MENTPAFLNEEVDMYLSGSALNHEYTPPCEFFYERMKTQNIC